TFNYTHTNNEPTKYTYHPSNDNPSHFAGVVSCFFPIVGLVLYFMWKDDKP
ncbi:MAG TPA: zinc ribbon domain-containing protein, partial [Firmicutes bacterium]|nr:zinc ribbon domain-containing protein [Bacillota bacterium]